MNNLEHGQNYSSCYGNKNHCVIRTVPSSLWIVKRWQKFYALFSRYLEYKTALPILEITLKIYSKQGEKVEC